MYCTPDTNKILPVNFTSIIKKVNTEKKSPPSLPDPMKEKVNDGLSRALKL